MSPKSVADCSRRAVEALVRAGLSLDDSRRDVAVVSRHLLGWDLATWLTDQQTDAPARFDEELAALMRRRAAGEPVAYLLGEKEFYGRSFMVSPDVLVPRPETELLVERALARLDARVPGDRAPDVVDVGTGSGCIAITVAAERQAVRIVATDVSTAALEVAAANAVRHGVSDRIEFIRGAQTAGVGNADLVVSNPPYVPETDRAGLMREVREFEPPTALFGGPDGLEIIERLVPDALRVLQPGGWLLVEIGEGQAGAVVDLFERTGFTTIDTHRDLAGITRVVEGAAPGGFV